MRPIYHLVASLALAIILFVITKSITASIVIILAGVFIDLDHLIDFWVLKPENPFSVKEFLNSEKYNKQAKYIFVFFHAYEWLIILLVINYLLNWPLYLLAFTLAITLHLTLDLKNLRYHTMHPLSYFIIFRILKKFKKYKRASR